MTIQRDRQFLEALASLGDWRTANDPYRNDPFRDVIKPNHDAHVRTYRLAAIRQAFAGAASQGESDNDNMKVGGFEEITLGEMGQ